MARGLNVFVNIGAKVGSSLGASASAVERRFQTMSQRIRVMGAETQAHMAVVEKRWGRFSANASDFAYSVSLPMAAVSALGAKTAYSWAKVGNELQAVTQMSDAARKSIESVARAQIGNPVENLKAALDLGRTGFTEAQIKTSLPTVIKLAKSDPSVDTSAASDIATNVIQGMGLKAEDFGRAADLLAYGAARSSTDVRLLGQSFKYAGPMAAQLGMKMDELTAIFMTMADAGIKGSESGVAFRSMMVKMLKPTKEGVATLDRLGVKLGDFVNIGRALDANAIVASLKTQGVDASGQASAIQGVLNNKSLSGGDLIERLTDAVATGTASAMDKDKLSDAIAGAMFAGANKVDAIGFMKAFRDKGGTIGDLVRFVDSRQGSRLTTLQSGTGLRDNLAEVRSGSTGYLDKMFNTQNKGVVGAYGRLQQSLGGLLITAAESGVIDTFANAMDRLSGAVTALGKASPGLLRLATYSILFLAVLGPLAMGLGGIVAGIKLVGGGLAFIAPFLLRSLLWFRGAALGVSLFAAVAGVPLWLAVGAIAALGLGLAFVISKWSGIKAFFGGFAKGFMQAINPVLPQLQAFGASIAPVMAVIIWPFKKLGELVGGVFTLIGKMFAPAETAKWAGWGVAVGTAIGGVVTHLVQFVELIGKAVSGLGTLLGMGPGGKPAVSKPPGRALGGGVSRGGLYTVGESGRELFAPGRSGTIIPARTTAALMAGGGRGANDNGRSVTIGTINVYEAQDAQATARAVRAELARTAGESRRYLND